MSGYRGVQYICRGKYSQEIYEEIDINDLSKQRKIYDLVTNDFKSGGLTVRRISKAKADRLVEKWAADPDNYTPDKWNDAFLSQIAKEVS